MSLLKYNFDSVELGLEDEDLIIDSIGAVQQGRKTNNENLEHSLTNVFVIPVMMVDSLDRRVVENFDKVGEKSYSTLSEARLHHYIID